VGCALGVFCSSCENFHCCWLYTVHCTLPYSNRSVVEVEERPPEGADSVGAFLAGCIK